MKKLALCLALFSVPFVAVHSKTVVTALPDNVDSVTKVYSQVVSFTMPVTFFKGRGARQQAGTQFMLELVPEGQTVEQWQQMITLTGIENALKTKTANAQMLVNSIGTGFKNACPSSFNYKALSGNQKLSAVVFSCGDFEGHSETTLVVGMNGLNDVYTLQWAERGERSTAPLRIDEANWSKRLTLLNPRLAPSN